jgi:hypothetical protein
VRNPALLFNLRISRLENSSSRVRVSQCINTDSQAKLSLHLVMAGTSCLRECAHRISSNLAYAHDPVNMLERLYRMFPPVDPQVCIV